MKYTKKYMLENKIAIHVGRDIEAIKKIDKLVGSDYYYLYNGGNEPEKCLSPGEERHGSKGWYDSNGYTVISIEDFFSDIYSDTYSIY